jgi:hypothetical protein
MTKRCTKCVLPDTIPNITFDGNGVCHYCREYTQEGDVLHKRTDERRLRLDELIEDSHKRSSKSEYDVLVPLSGGRDSSYVAWALKVKHKLRVLCVNYSNPFSSAQAVKNVDRLVERLGVDCIRFTWPGRRHERSFKNNLKAWLKKPDLGTTGLLCLGCKPFYLKFYEIANKNNIGLIIDGSNPNEATQFKVEARLGSKDNEGASRNPVLRMAKKLIKNAGYIRPCNFYPGLHTLMSLDGHTRYLEWRYPTIEKHGYFWCYPYEEKEINKTLEELGWEKSSDNKSPWRFDCEIDSLKNYLFTSLVGATEKEDLFSKNIRAGLMTRTEALERLDEGEINPAIIERVLAKVGMRWSDLEDLRRPT